MQPLAPFTGGLFRLAFMTAGAVALVAVAIMFFDARHVDGGAGGPLRESTLPFESVPPPMATGWSKEDRRFAVIAAGLAEEAVRLSELAMTRAAADAVRKLATRIVSGQQALRDELWTLAGHAEVSLPVGAGARAEHRLEEKSPVASDRDFLRELVNVHHDEIALFKNAARDCEDAGLREFARRSLPNLKANAELVRNLKSDAR